MKITLFDNPLSFYAPISQNPSEYPHMPYTSRN